MKTFIAAVVLFLAVPAVSHAWEFSRNPDRFPSLAFNVSNASLPGHRDEVDNPTGASSRIQSGATKSELLTIGGDVRLPLQESLTLSVYYDFVSTDDTFTRQNNVYKQTDKADGYRAGFSLRLYFNK